MKRYVAPPETTELNVMQNLCKKKKEMQFGTVDEYEVNLN